MVSSDCLHLHQDLSVLRRPLLSCTCLAVILCFHVFRVYLFPYLLFTSIILLPLCFPLWCIRSNRCDNFPKVGKWKPIKVRGFYLRWNILNLHGETDMSFHTQAETRAYQNSQKNCINCINPLNLEAFLGKSESLKKHKMLFWARSTIRWAGEKCRCYCSAEQARCSQAPSVPAPPACSQGPTVE